MSLKSSHFWVKKNIKFVKNLFPIVVGLALNSFVFSIIADRVWHCSATRLSSTFQFGSRELFPSVLRLQLVNNVFVSSNDDDDEERVEQTKKSQVMFRDNCDMRETSSRSEHESSWIRLNCTFMFPSSKRQHNFFLFPFDHTKLFIILRNNFSLSTEAENTKKNFCKKSHLLFLSVLVRSRGRKDTQL